MNAKGVATGGFPLAQHAVEVPGGEATSRCTCRARWCLSPTDPVRSTPSYPAPRLQWLQARSAPGLLGTKLANICDNGSDDGSSEENLVGEDDSSELDQDISDRPSEDDFKTEVDISRKVLENMVM